MKVRFTEIGYKDAIANPGYILPWVIDSKEASEYSFYAAIADDSLAGILVADKKVYEPEILSIGISPEFENLGIGSALLEFVTYDILSAYDENEILSDNRIVGYAYGEIENIAAVTEIFNKCGYSVYEEGHFCEITLEMLKKNDILQNPSILNHIDSEENKGEFVSYKHMDKSVVHAFSNSLIEKEILPGIDFDEIEEDISFFGMKDGEITSCLLFATESNRTIQNLCFYNKNTDLASSKKMLHLFTVCSRAILELYPAGTRISFWTGNEVAKGLIDKLFPDAQPKQAKVSFELSIAAAFGKNDERFTDSIPFTPVTNDSMVCKDCRHCTDMITSCNKYQQKPTPVLDGKECKLFENK